MLQIFKNRSIEKFRDRNTKPIAKFLHNNHGNVFATMIHNSETIGNNY